MFRSDEEEKEAKRRELAEMLMKAQQAQKISGKPISQGPQAIPQRQRIQSIGIRG